MRSMFAEEKGMQLTEFKKKICSYLIFIIKILCENTVFKPKRGEKLQTFSGIAIPTNCIWDKPNLFVNTSLCSDSSQFAIFSQFLVNADFCLYLG